MYRIFADKNKNRVYIILKGTLNSSQLREAAELFISEVKKLKAPVDVINDISEFNPDPDTNADEIIRAQKFVREYGLNRVVRVIREKMDGAIPFVTGGIEVGIRSDLVYSVEEAETLLDK